MQSSALSWEKSSVQKEEGFIKQMSVVIHGHMM